MTLLQTWDQVQDHIKEAIGHNSYETWFSNLGIQESPSGTLVISTPDEFFKNWIIEHYQPLIEQKISASHKEPFKLLFSVADIQAASAQLNTSAKQDSKKLLERSTSQPEDPHLNPRFSFNNFVVGPSNRFAYAACLAVAESPAKAYNPLFIYGHVGLGKTHLMQAITHQIKLHHPDITTAYISSEKFTNELIEAIRHRATSQFRQKYRNIDVLLIDDIHFIAGKESTQEEFFHTFNALHNSRKQIIISSDRPPKEITNLEERLSSRFTWGLITDIQPPDYETRVAILRKKSEQEPVQISDDVISYIAEEIKTNIRELEGALIRVVAYALLEDRPISLEMAKFILKDMVKQSIKVISLEMIQKKVADFFNLSVSDLKSKRRNKNLLFPRQVAMYLTRQLTDLSLPEIGSAFGGKDHTTVLHSCRKIESEKDIKADIGKIINNLLVELKG